MLRLVFGMIAVLALFHSPAQANPPYEGTIFVNPNIITARDRSSFRSLKYIGTGNREMFDRRVAAWVNTQAFLFKARFARGTMEVRVNIEFGSKEAAGREAYKHAQAIGRLPRFVLGGIQTISIHRGNENFGGGSKDLLIHTGRTAEYEASGFLEETLFHEAVHASIDPVLSRDRAWRTAQQRDGKYISRYAQAYPDREDLAESLLMYYGVAFRTERMRRSQLRRITRTIPNRLLYFTQKFPPRGGKNVLSRFLKW